jgi:excisionase family DNA binding protein
MTYTTDDLMVKLEGIEFFIKSLTPKDRLMSLQSIVKYTSLSYSTIRRHIMRGTLKPFKKDGKKLFRRTDVDNWLKG